MNPKDTIPYFRSDLGEKGTSNGFPILFGMEKMGSPYPVKTVLISFTKTLRLFKPMNTNHFKITHSLLRGSGYLVTGYM